MAIATLYHAVSVSSKRLASGGVAVSERHVLRARGGGSRAVDVGSETVGDAALESVDPCTPAATRLEPGLDRAVRGATLCDFSAPELASALEPRARRRPKRNG